MFKGKEKVHFCKLTAQKKRLQLPILLLTVKCSTWVGHLNIILALAGRNLNKLIFKSSSGWGVGGGGGFLDNNYGLPMMI